MKWIDRYPSLSLLTIATAVFAFCLADGAFVLAVVAAIVLLIAWLFRHREQPMVLPKFVINLFVLTAILHAAISRGAADVGPAVVSDLGEFLVYVQLIKLFDRRSHRDEIQCLTLSLFVVVAAILTSNSLGLGVLLICYAPIIVATSMLVQIRRGNWHRSTSAPFPTSARVQRRLAFPTVTSSKPASRATSVQHAGADKAGGKGLRRLAKQRAQTSADRRFSRLTAQSTFFFAIIAAAVFVLAPRGLGEGNFGGLGMIQTRSIGYTETIKLGQGGFLNESSRPVLDMKVTDQEGRNVGLGQVFYLRGTTRNEYDRNGRIWQGAVERGDVGTHLISSHLPANTSYLAQKITMRGTSRQSRLFSVWRPVSVTIDNSTSTPTLPDITEPRVFSRSDLTLSASNDRQRRVALSYTVISAPNVSIIEDEPPQATFNRLPERIGEIAAEVIAKSRVAPNADRNDPLVIRQIASAIRDYLQVGFEYTTDLPSPPGSVDPIVWFLETSKRGHCEYYASAMTTMLQSLGVPARLVTGYVAAEFNSLTGEYVVRESNAHAWVEVYLGNGRWQTFDPTPSGVIDNLHRPSDSLASQIRQWYDMIEFNWSSSIVGFDKLKQSSLLGRKFAFKDFFSDITGWLNDTGERAMDRLRLGKLTDRVPPAILPLLPLILVVSVFLYMFSNLILNKLSSLRRTTSVDPELATILHQAEFYTQSLSHLAHAGVEKPPSRPPLAHADALKDDRSPLADSFSKVTSLFYRLRFGRHTLTPEEVRAAREAAGELAQAAGVGNDQNQKVR